jgi:hypothetical protein
LQSQLDALVEFDVSFSGLIELREVNVGIGIKITGIFFVLVCALLKILSYGETALQVNYQV